ncbi:MAG: 6,7-dimethyl-8-ribityllumazine synthase [Fibrobacterota bacterium]|nr:6,7-dimethyl-8-ribityllumazine synthase [Fibrobacterota bacterium]QQS04021.1 MAG: 6,7-dimethyl-8-ribityllumazine synthase [Fibrobacterota bacterium]
MRSIDGSFVAPSKPVALVASRFNSLVVEPLVEGARDGLVRHGVADDQIVVIRVPGAWEIGAVARRCVDSMKYSAVIALGCVIRGETPHFDQVVSGTTRALGQLAYEANVPVVFAVLTTEDLEQAQQRAGGKVGNKGWEAALSALELCDLYRKIGEA